MKTYFKKYFKLYLAAIISTLVLSGCGEDTNIPVSKQDGFESTQATETDGAELAAENQAVTEPAAGPESVETVAEPEPEIVTVELVAVGDNLIHEGLYKTGMNAEGEWNYDHVYAPVKDEIEGADLAVINQETIFIKDRNKISAYPRFGSPPEIGTSLVNMGFDVILHASNHTVDKGREGVWDTLNFWKEEHPEITVLGINESEEEQNTIDVVECNGIRFAMLNYTYGLNGLPMPEGEPFLVNLLDKEKVAADIAKAKECSDMIIAFCHMGDEYVYEPSIYARDWVEFLLEQGVDISINAHPHVVEPYEVLIREDGHEMLVYYSLGNFVSTQDRVPRLLGGMAKVTIQMTVDKEEKYFSITDYTLEPLVAHWNYRTMEFGVYMLEDYTNEQAEKHGIHRASGEPFSVEILWDLFNGIVGDNENDTRNN